MIPLELEALIAFTRLTLHSSSEARREVYRMLRTPAMPLAAMLDVIERETESTPMPSAPRDGTCPVCDARLWNGRGHLPLCVLKVECSRCGATTHDGSVCPEQAHRTPEEPQVALGALSAFPWPPERKRLITLCRRAFAEMEGDGS
jgi:hypothetical protein